MFVFIIALFRHNNVIPVSLFFVFAIVRAHPLPPSRVCMHASRPWNFKLCNKCHLIFLCTCVCVSVCVKACRGASQGMFVSRNLLYRMSLPLLQHNAFLCSYTRAFGLQMEAVMPPLSQTPIKKSKCHAVFWLDSVVKISKSRDSHSLSFRVRVCVSEPATAASASATVHAHINLCTCRVELARMLWVEVCTWRSSVSVCVCVCFALKAIAVARLQLLRSEKQDPALLLTHILSNTRQQPLNSCQKSNHLTASVSLHLQPHQPLSNRVEECWMLRNPLVGKWRQNCSSLEGCGQRVCAEGQSWQFRQQQGQKISI